jgi:hypothetical protein
MRPIIDLDSTTPTMFLDALELAAERAFEKAESPDNILDDNPRIGAMWMAVGMELRETKRRLEARDYEIIDSPSAHFQSTVGRRGDC